ncbi:MAG: hypothetical protein JO184_04970 [Gammaproteobacteria bacterium]|nr:hypothetical protein [Gammaproteobacteria bacterium]MBV8405398.1 hypothetical protein [Gammaproteobacteria bacterium]
MRISTVIKAVLAATAVTPLLCQAESTFNSTGASPSTAVAHVDFQITIPKFIFLRVGTGTGAVNAAGVFTTAPATNGAIDQITWAPGAAVLGNGTAIAGTGGDLTGGVETAVLVANNGTVTLTSSTAGALNDGGAGDTISYSTITTTASANHTATTLAAPALADGTTTTVTLTPTAPSKVIDQDAKWAYTWANNIVPAAGVYGGVNANNSRVTYTASVP